MIFFKKLFHLLGKKDKNRLIALVVFSIFISLIEMVGVSVIMPFIQVATDPSIIESNYYLSWFYHTLNFEDTKTFVIFFGVVLIFFYLFRSMINYLYFYVLAKYAQGRYHILASKLFERYLKMPYRNFIQNNSSILSKSIITEAQLLTTIIIALLMMLSEFFVIVLIYTVMVLVNLKITIFLTLLLGINSIFMIKVISPKIKQAGIKRAKYQQVFYEVINKSFGNYKMIKLNTLDKQMYQEFTKTSSNFVKSNIQNQALSNFPRLFLEAIAFTIIIVIVLYLIEMGSEMQSSQSLLSQVSIFVLSLYRLMPSINRIMTAYNQILFNHKALDIIYDNMHYQNEVLGDKKLSFSKEILLQDISFAYNNDIDALRNINFTFRKNEKIAIIGESGSGKSTLVDIIIGLHKPTSGMIYVDQVPLCDYNLLAWRSKIGYIPQSPYLFDGTVGENIAFGLEYDKVKINAVLKQAQIYDIFQKKEGIDTRVGENGITLSGGQRQRIAIARALYKDPEILVLDEATSALDYDTEMKIMEEIYEIAKDKTLIIIAHRLSTIQGCDRIIELREGKIINITIRGKR